MSRYLFALRFITFDKSIDILTSDLALLKSNYKRPFLSFHTASAKNRLFGKSFYKGGQPDILTENWVGDMVVSIFDFFAGMDVNNIEKTFDQLDKVVDDYFGEVGQRRRFMQACRKLSDDDLLLIQNVVHGEVPSDKIPGRVTAAESPLRLANALLMLEKDIETTEDINIFLFLYEVLKRNNVIKGLNRAWFFYWEEPFLENPITPSDLIDLIWQFCKSGKYDEMNDFYLYKGFQNTQTALRAF
jgi:hypothetical protein